MLAAAKYGCLGIGESTDLDIISMDYSRQLKLYLNCQIEFQKVLESDDIMGFNEIAKNAVVESTWKTVNSNKVILFLVRSKLTGNVTLKFHPQMLLL